MCEIFVLSTWHVLQPSWGPQLAPSSLRSLFRQTGEAASALARSSSCKMLVLSHSSSGGELRQRKFGTGAKMKTKSAAVCNGNVKALSLLEWPVRNQCIAESLIGQLGGL